jgi:hypothetical protein
VLAGWFLTVFDIPGKKRWAMYGFAKQFQRPLCWGFAAGILTGHGCIK